MNGVSFKKKEKLSDRTGGVTIMQTATKKETVLGIRQMAMIGVMTAVTCIAAPFSIPIPVSPVPLSLTTFILYLSVYILGTRNAFISYVIYLLLVLFLFSYLRIMPIQYKLIVLGIVYCFTILTPTITIFLFRKINGFARQELSERKKRYVPILLTIISYVFCLLMMRRLNIPWYMTGIILASLVVSIICIAVNLKWKLSEHMAGMGGVIGGLISFSALFGYNPVGWLCLFILIAGILGSARIVLGHHTLGEVLSGFAVGLICALLVLHPVSNILFRVFLF